LLHHPMKRNHHRYSAAEKVLASHDYQLLLQASIYLKLYHF
uniref:IS1 family transposase n=1 Tax=Brugia timori TaxID=42155 RepID=A0A0R3QHA4_9BILA